MKSAAQARRGDVFVAEVRDLASDGRGVLAHPSGLTLFAAGVWPGEEGRFRVVSRQSRTGTAELIELLQTAQARIPPPCPHHGVTEGRCGGCPWQFIDYRAQVAAKQRRVESALQRIGVDCVRPLIEAPEIFAYRNRAQLKTDGRQIGYVSQGSRCLAPITQCPVLSATNQDTLRSLLARLPNPDWAPRRREDWTTLNLDDSLAAGAVRVNRRLPFRQSNSAQNARMRAWLAEACADLDRAGPVLELFCGSGNFTQVLAQAGFESILAVDAAGEAIDSLRGRALPGVTALALDLYQAGAFDQIATRFGRYQSLVLDPPRDGLRQRDGLIGRRSQLRDVFYISCDLATFARDLGFFQTSGYKPLEVQPLDQAPHTPHVELLAHLRRD